MAKKQIEKKDDSFFIEHKILRTVNVNIPMPAVKPPKESGQPSSAAVVKPEANSQSNSTTEE